MSIFDLLLIASPIFSALYFILILLSTTPLILGFITVERILLTAEQGVSGETGLEYSSSWHGFFN